MQKTVLVIDDNTDIRENTAEILQLAGYSTLTAEHGKTGVELATEKKPSLIICDIMMPELDGYAVLHLLRKNPATQNIPFIFLTAKTERSDLRKGMEMGADDYISKPFDDMELLNAVEARFKRQGILEQDYPASAEGLTAFLNNINNNALPLQYDVEFYPKKQVLYTEGRIPRYLYYVVKGTLKAYKSGDDGKEYITDLYNAGDMIGYTALIEDSHYDDSVSVLEDAEVMQVPKDDFLQILNSDINIASKFIRIIARNVKEKEDRLLSLAYGSLRKRVAKALVDISVKFQQAGQTGSLAISRDDIARYTGTATESLIRTLSDFKTEQLIEIKNGKILLTDIEKLRRLVF